MLSKKLARKYYTASESMQNHASRIILKKNYVFKKKEQKS